MKQFVNKSVLMLSFVAIIFLISLNIFLTLRNNKTIEKNRLLQKQAEDIKVTVSQFAIVIIHNLDLGLRGYALFRKDKYLYPMQFALNDKDSLMIAVEYALGEQNYPLAEFRVLRDSMNAYAKFCLKMKDLFDRRQIGEFERLADLDKGYHVWMQYEAFATKVFEFENRVNDQAKERYQAAMRNNYIIQVVLLLVTVPTLLISGLHTYKRFAYEFRLRTVESEKAVLLSQQNERLEELVARRTEKIHDQNLKLQEQHDEITAQNEEIKAQNDELHSQREGLALQNEELIRSKKQQLELYTQNIAQKTEMIDRISAELELLKSKTFTDIEQVEKFNSILQYNILTEEDWENFKKVFEAVYPNFFAGLRYHFPEITASEMRLSALIRMNLTLKEAAGVLGISAESVKKSRYRLKRKLGLNEEDSLEEFISRMK
jgi:CHASE3 domain sensor protein